MNPERKQQWVDALRSEEYRQGYGRLKYIEEDGKASFCCLGVACDLAQKDGAISEYHDDDFSPSFGDFRETGVLPNEVVQWLGIDSINPMVEDGGNLNTLSGLNDSGHYLFEDIATLIEEQL